jgi:hypothetical protein
MMDLRLFDVYFGVFVALVLNWGGTIALRCVLLAWILVLSGKLFSVNSIRYSLHSSSHDYEAGSILSCMNINTAGTPRKSAHLPHQTESSLA